MYGVHVAVRRHPGIFNKPRDMGCVGLGYVWLIWLRWTGVVANPILLNSASYYFRLVTGVSESYLYGNSVLPLCVPLGRIKILLE